MSSLSNEGMMRIVILTLMDVPPGIPSRNKRIDSFTGWTSRMTTSCRSWIFQSIVQTTLCSVIYHTVSLGSVAVRSKCDVFGGTAGMLRTLLDEKIGKSMRVRDVKLEDIGDGLECVHSLTSARHLNRTKLAHTCSCGVPHSYLPLCTGSSSFPRTRRTRTIT